MVVGQTQAQWSWEEYAEETAASNQRDSAAGRPSSVDRGFVDRFRGCVWQQSYMAWIAQQFKIGPSFDGGFDARTHSTLSSISHESPGMRDKVLSRITRFGSLLHRHR